MPPAFQSYVALGDDLVARLAEEPDLIFHDNIQHQGDRRSSAGWYHSHKLVRDARGRLRHLAGSVRTPIQAAPWLIIRARGRGELAMIPDLLVEISHYTVDATTLPHLTRELTGKEHVAFEHAVRDRLPDLLSAPAPLVLPRPRDLGGSVPIVCRETYLSQIVRVRSALAAGTLPEETALLREIVARCLAFTLAVWHELWREISPASCACAACEATGPHASDCAVHNAPALPPGPCDCRDEEEIV